MDGGEKGRVEMGAGETDRMIEKRRGKRETGEGWRERRMRVGRVIPNKEGEKERRGGRDCSIRKD